MISEVTNTTSVVRVHRRNTNQPCGNRVCPRRHVWESTHDCGWRRFYRKRWEARRALMVFHMEYDHGGADD